MNRPPIDEQRPAPKRRFTFLQLIVSLAVISILLGLLWAWLGKERETSRRATCLNSLKGIGLSFRLYSGDNNERFPCDVGHTTLGSMALLTNNYQASYRTWICPSDISVRPGSVYDAWTAANLSYAYNGFGLAETTQPDTPLFCDRTSGDLRALAPWRHNRWTHGNAGGSVLYADGHGAFLEILEVPMYRARNP